MIVHHVGIVVENIKDSMGIYQKIGYKLISEIIYDYSQNNKLVFLKEKNSKQVIELIEPIDINSPVANKNNKGLHHICFEVDNLDDYIKNFEKLKIGKVFTKKIKAPAFDGREIVFCYLKDGNIVEILQKGDDINFKQT